MGLYAVTGGLGGIGRETVKLLRRRGHQVIAIDLRKCEIEADLALPEGRQKAIDELNRLCPEGLDGMILSAGVPASCKDPRLLVALNYFGATAMAKGAYGLLKKRGGSCVAVSSNAISQGAVPMDLADLLNNNGSDEQRILNVVGRMDRESLKVCNRVYVAAKYALARWVRRHSASYAANGVRLNAVAPGNVNTAMTATMSSDARAALNALPIPTKYGTEAQMEPAEVAEVIVFLASPAARGVNGNIMFVDGGTDALLNTEKVY